MNTLPVASVNSSTHTQILILLTAASAMLALSGTGVSTQMHTGCTYSATITLSMCKNFSEKLMAYHN